MYHRIQDIEGGKNTQEGVLVIQDPYRGFGRPRTCMHITVLAHLSDGIQDKVGLHDRYSQYYILFDKLVRFFSTPRSCFVNIHIGICWQDMIEIDILNSVEPKVSKFTKVNISSLNMYLTMEE